MLPLVEARGRRSRLAVLGDFSGRLASIVRGTRANFPGVTGTGWDVPGIGSRPGDRRARRIVRNLIGTGWDARPAGIVNRHRLGFDIQGPGIAAGKF